VWVTHASAGASAPSEATPSSASSAESPELERYRAMITRAFERTTNEPSARSATRTNDDRGEARARALSPTDLVHLDDCPEVSRLVVLHPNEHRVARARDEAIRVKEVPSARVERRALREHDPARLGTWVHAALADCGLDAEPDPDAVARALAREPLGEDAPLFVAYVARSLASARAALRILGVREVIAQELPFVVNVDGTLLRGAIDLVVRTDEGVRVMDLKTHPLDPRALSRSAGYYRVQLDAYAFAASTLLREPVVGRDLLLPSSGALVTLEAPFDRGAFETQVRSLGALAAVEARGPGPGADCARCPWAPVCRVADEGA
jgi:ATP-dependent exoDNAse (exonuclease V) beta subunit